MEMCCDDKQLSAVQPLKAAQRGLINSSFRCRTVSFISWLQRSDPWGFAVKENKQLTPATERVHNFIMQNANGTLLYRTTNSKAASTQFCFLFCRGYAVWRSSTAFRFARLPSESLMHSDKSNTPCCFHGSPGCVPRRGRR